MTLELRGSARPTLQQALRWIGSRVDDIYGASIGKLEDIWMDPDSGEPLWLLVRDGRIGGRHTLVPFAQAASGAGHVWIPFEREVVRGAPAVRPSAPLSHELSDTLRRYYAESGHPVGGTSAPRRPFASPRPSTAAQQSSGFVDQARLAEPAPALAAAHAAAVPRRQRSRRPQPPGSPAAPRAAAAGGRTSAPRAAPPAALERRGPRSGSGDRAAPAAAHAAQGPDAAFAHANSPPAPAGAARGELHGAAPARTADASASLRSAAHPA